MSGLSAVLVAAVVSAGCQAQPAQPAPAAPAGASPFLATSSIRELMESTNLLMMTGRHVARAGEQTNKADDADPGAELPPAMIEKRINQDWPVWLGMAQALHTSAASMLDAVDKKDVRRLESTGSELDGVCETCHLTFWYPPRPAR